MTLKIKQTSKNEYEINCISKDNLIQEVVTEDELMEFVQDVNEEFIKITMESDDVK